MTVSASHSLLILALVFLPGLADRSAADDCGLDATEQALLERVNEARGEARQCGDESFDAAQPLSWNCKLEDAALAHSTEMAELEFFSHTGPDGVRIGERVNDRGYRWSAVGENIAAGQNSVDDVVDGWLSSPGHCANIMSPKFTEMGAARVEAPGSQYSPFWTQVFARPR
ncbi:Cysteine-rich secretory protein family protein [Marinobacter daqiaonensis]|uniref:Cysteine-rich secretory protein family protein n=1 Tax=Marinobacter daqiaonensis TaxID=650891 RepID=A0A1I6GSZ0_9GAMM|nr:CAP domain-containing protein [Marinobacter daqiaonensis]SFR45209.1 Cysteine-rich secretory protein family protein [Marinobacter daqiaonensis]